MIEIGIKTFGFFIAVFSFSMLINSPKKYLIWAGISGAAAGFIYVICIKFGWNVVIASFWSALAAGLISHIFARILKAPVTIFLIGGILPTVPGNGIYQIMNYVIQNDRTMASFYLTQTIEIAGVIALAIFLMDTVFKVVRRGEWKQDSLRYIQKDKGKEDTK